MFSDASIQVDLDTKIHDKLQILYDKIVSDRNSFKIVIENTFAIFNGIKKQPYKNFAFELRLCASIAGECSKFFPKNLGSVALFEHALAMQNFYLKHFFHDRELLKENLITQDSYKNLTRELPEQPEKSLSSLLDDNYISDEIAPLVLTKSTQVNIPKELKDTLSPEYKIGVSEKVDYDFVLRLETIKAQSPSARKRKMFESLEKDIINHIYDLKKIFPLHTSANYSTQDTIIVALQLALTVEAAFISYLKNNGNNTTLLAKLLQKASFLFRNLNDYYQVSDASEEIKNYIKSRSYSAQNQAASIKSIISCSNVVRSNETSASEKLKARHKKAEFVDISEAGISELCSQYYDIIEDGGDFAYPEPVVMVTDDTYQMLMYEFSRIQASFPALSFGPFLYLVTSYLDSILANVITQNFYHSSYMQYIDGNEQQEIIDLSRSILLSSDAGAGLYRTQLLQAIELFYNTKMAFLDESLYCVSRGSSQEQYILYNKFLSQSRSATYRYLLAEPISNNLEQALIDCEYILKEQTRSSPLINALAQHRLSVVKTSMAEITPIQPDNIEHQDSKESSSQSKTLSKSAKKRAKKRAQTLKKNNYAASLEGQWREIESIYVQTTLSTPGWIEIKMQIIEHVDNDKISDALILIDEWIIGKTEDSTLDKLLLDKGLLDAYIHKAILLRDINYEDALLCLEKALEHLAPESYKSIRVQQILRIMIEKGILYSNQDKISLAKITFAEANKIAEDSGTLCFYILNSKLEMLQDPNEAITIFKDSIEYLLNNPMAALVEEYQMVYFYLFYEKLASIIFNQAAEALRQVALNKYLGKINPVHEQKSTVLIENTLNIYKILLMHAKEYCETKILTFEMKIGITYRSFMSIAPQRMYFLKANEHFNSALSLANKVGNQFFIDLITSERKKLKQAVEMSKLITAKSIMEDSKKEFEQKCQISSEHIAEIPINTITDIEYLKSEMLKAMQNHISLIQLKNLLRILDFKTPSKTLKLSAIDKRKQQSFEKTASIITLTELSKIRQNIDALVAFYSEKLSKMEKKQEIVPEELIEIYAVHLQFLEDLKYLRHQHELEVIVGFNNDADRLLPSIAMQTEQVLICKEQIDLHGKQNTIVVAPTPDECASLLVVHYNLGLPQAEIDSFVSMGDMGCRFNKAIDYINTKDYWMALINLFDCLEEPLIKNNHLKSSIVNYLIANIMLYTLNLINSDFAHKIYDEKNTEAIEYLNVTFSRIKPWCSAMFRKAKNGMAIVNEEKINQKIHEVKQMDLQIPTLETIEDQELGLKIK